MLKIEKFADVCMTGGMHYTTSHTNVCKSRCPKFSESHKRSPGRVINETVSEFFSSFPGLQCVRQNSEDSRFD